jgi:moderate conductance mechanosensitive channel
MFLVLIQSHVFRLNRYPLGGKSDIIKLMLSDIFDGLEIFLDELPQRFGGWFDRNSTTLFKIVVVVIISWLVSRFATSFVHSLLEGTVRDDMYPTKTDREKRVKTLSGLGSALIRFMVWVISGIIIINLLGVNTAPILASAGILGVALGFGAQKLINDLVSGVFIISENQYRVGDFVELEGVSGVVEQITIRTTVLRDLNGAVHHIPNGSIIITTNKSMGFGQINLDIAVAPDTDLKLLEHLINHAGERIANNVEVKDEIIEPPKFIRVSDFTGTGVTVKVMGKTAGGKQLEIKSAFFTELKKALDEHKIKLAVVLPPPATHPKSKK